MPRTKPAEQRRSELLDAAEEIVVRQGVDAFTIDDVTGGAGVAKGTFYLHFANKDNLIGALRDRWLKRFIETQQEAAQKFTGIASVEAWLRVGVSEYMRDVSLHDVLFHPATNYRAVPNVVVEALTDLLTDLRPPVADPLATAVVLYSTMHGVTDHITHAPDDEWRMLNP